MEALRTRPLDGPRGMLKDSPVSVKLSLLSARKFFRDPLETARSQRPDAGINRFAAGTARYVLVRDPDAIWRVLVTDGAAFGQGKWKRRSRRYVGDSLNTLDGAEHRLRRRVIQKSISRRRVLSFAPAIAARADRMQSSWQQGRLVLRDALDPLCLCIAGDVLLSTDLEPRSAELARELVRMVRGLPRLIPPVRGTRHGRALAYVNGEIDDLIDKRRAVPEPAYDDLLGALMASGLSDRCVRGDVLACLLAAVDEPTAALQSAWRLLAVNASAEDRLHAELDEVLGGRRPGADDVGRLPYLTAVIQETLRLDPPARHVDRCPAEDVRVAGEPVRAGTNVIVSPLVTHHEPRLHENPDAFEPERWLDAGGRSRPHERGAYIPFGAGVHTCVGEPLATAIMTLTLASVARRWRLRLAAPAPKAPSLTFELELR